MFSKYVLAGLLSVVSSVSMAAVNLGSYSGQTENNETCTLEISKEAKTYTVSVAYSTQEACSFKAHHANETNKELKVSGEQERAVCKVKVALANDGTPIEAKMGVGQYFQFGFDVTCSNLQKDQ